MRRRPPLHGRQPSARRPECRWPMIGAHAAIALVAGFAVSASAAERQQIGPRSTAMGGADVVSAEASALIWANPALLGLPGPDGPTSSGFDAGAGLTAI